MIDKYGERFAGVHYHDKEDGHHLMAVDDAESAVTNER
jgi:hypothetical protein